MKLLMVWPLLSNDSWTLEYVNMWKPDNAKVSTLKKILDHKPKIATHTVGRRKKIKIKIETPNFIFQSCNDSTDKFVNKNCISRKKRGKCDFYFLGGGLGS